ncbi:MAG: hypothetical protein JST16_07170 [Bdellovibrionales bacterium]|nr:hypothetical protein [Bdellovibrionales bacterium]
MKTKMVKMTLVLPALLSASSVWSAQRVVLGANSQILSVEPVSATIMDADQEIKPTAMVQMSGNLSKISWVKRADAYEPVQQSICDSKGDVPFYDLRDVPPNASGGGYILSGGQNGFKCTAQIKDVGDVEIAATGAIILWGTKQSPAKDDKAFIYSFAPVEISGKTLPTRLSDWAQAATPDAGLNQLTSYLTKNFTLSEEQTEDSVTASLTIVDSFMGRTLP